ncbi:uncharacterized protein ACMZJ9_017731 [Mantella aurantiaca]
MFGRKNIKAKSKNEENQKKTIIVSGKHFIKVFQKLLKETTAKSEDKFLYLQRVYHSIFFFGHINRLQIKPEEFITNKKREALKEKFPKPFQEYNTHLPRQTPYSILLEYITKIYGGDHESILEELEKRNKDLLDNCYDDEGNKLSAKNFSLSAPVIAHSCFKDSCNDSENIAYGSSLAYKGSVPSRIMIAISALFVWDKVISYAVRCGDNGCGIKFPLGVCCYAYQFDTKTHKYQRIPPCVKCFTMFIVKFDPTYAKTDKQEDWRYGNCAETESLSNLLNYNEDMRDRVFTLDNNEEAMNRDTIIERFAEEHEGPLMKEVNKLLESRRFKATQNGWAFFTPADYIPNVKTCHA